MHQTLDPKLALKQLPTETGIHPFLPGIDVVVHIPNADAATSGTLWDVKDLRRHTIYRIRRIPTGLQVEIVTSTSLKTEFLPLKSQTVWEAVLEILDFHVL